MAWRWTSGVAHGREWAMLIGDHTSTEPLRGGGQPRRTQVQASTGVAADMARLGVGLTEEACAKYEAYASRRR